MNKSLVSQINDYLDRCSHTTNKPKKVINFMKEGVADLVNIISKEEKISEQNKSYQNFRDYMEKYNDFPLFRTYNPEDNYEDFSMDLFKDHVNRNQFEHKISDGFIHNAEEKTLKTAIRAAIDGPTSYYKLSKKGVGLVKKVFKEYKQFEAFEKAMFMIKLVETIGYKNLVNILSLSDNSTIKNPVNTEQEGIELLKRENLAILYVDLTNIITKRMREESEEAYNIFYKDVQREGNLKDPQILVKNLKNIARKYEIK